MFFAGATVLESTRVESSPGRVVRCTSGPTSPRRRSSRQHSGQFLAMLSQSMQARRSADLAPKQLRTQRLYELASDRASFTDMPGSQCARLNSPSSHSHVSSHGSQRLSMRRQAVVWFCLLLTISVLSVAFHLAARNVTSAQTACEDVYRAIDVNVLVSMTTEELDYLQATSCSPGA